MRPNNALQKNLVSTATFKLRIKKTMKYSLTSKLIKLNEIIDILYTRGESLQKTTPKRPKIMSTTPKCERIEYVKISTSRNGKNLQPIVKLAFQIGFPKI